MDGQHRQPHTRDYLQRLGVQEPVPATTPFDRGYDPVTLEAHLVQSGHLMAGLKISMACWMVGGSDSTPSSSELRLSAEELLVIPASRSERNSSSVK